MDTGTCRPPYPLPLTNVLRADEPGPCLSNEKPWPMPDRADGFFRVKGYFDE
ncbi:MAG: Asp-tRNA(Asn)/Glu-tRNA(Gln) amidotransferase subunit GatC [Caldilineaceae bacterium]